MASSNRTCTSFTITQPFLGAPLQFQPALGSRELEDLIDLYVTGSASKQNKLSDITIDFYNNATVDLNTGALTRTYNVLPQWSNTAFEQSPTSQSSGFSPIFTPSPGSTAALADSAYGSFSMTPPTNNRGRVTKKPKKDTKKEAEVRLPGFSIMTKDGVDVTSSAGRGTKTKEQREHAHLMRIMKACPDCKKKKVRCDPSHRRSHDMSRTSTSTSATKSSSSSSHPKPSPPTTMPSLTPQTSYASGSTPSFSPPNAIDDFILFPPEDSWNTDMCLAGLETQDLGQFHFDINDLGNFPAVSDPSFDFSFDPQLSNFQFDNNLGHTPLMADQYGLDQWASAYGGDMPVHTRPHPSGASRYSGQLDPNFPAGWLQDVPAVSPTDSVAQGFYRDGSLRQPQLFQNSASNDSSPLSSVPDWSILEESINESTSQRDASAAGPSQSTGSSQRLVRKRRATDDESTESVAWTSLPLANQTGSGSDIDVDPSDVPFIATFADICQSTGDALKNLHSCPAEAAALGSELERLQAVLAQAQSDGNAGLQGNVLSQLRTLASQLQVISSGAREPRSGSPRHHRYNKLDPEFRLDCLQECQVQARRIVRSLCATINNAQAQNTGASSSTDGPIPTSGCNVHLFTAESEPQTRRPAASLESGVQMWVDSAMHRQTSSSSSGQSLDSTPGVILENSQPTVANTGSNGHNGPVRSRSLAEAANSGMLSISDIPRYSLVLNDTQSDRPFASRVAHHHEQPLSYSLGREDFDSMTELVFDEQAEHGVHIHRYRSYAQPDGSVIRDGFDNVNSQSSLAEDSATTISSPQYVGSPQDASPLRTNVDASLPGAIPGTTVANHQRRSLAAYQLVLPLLATLFASYIASSTGVYMSLSPCLLYFFSHFLPRPTSTTTWWFNFASMVIAPFFGAPIFDNLTYLKQTSSQWIGNDPIVAVIKLTLCATITAHLPHYIGRLIDSTDSFSRLGLTVMSFLSQFDGQSCRIDELLGAYTSLEESRSSPGRARTSMSWLAAMRELSPVAV